MPKTTNLGLNLTTDNTTLFSTWRESIDGEAADSNMQIIDKAIGDIGLLLDEINGEVVE